jgi:isochorismate synthase EntC
VLNDFFGATPEKVFSYRKKSLSTDALAGSIPIYGQNRKEIEEKFNNSTLQEEHKIVVKFLETQLKKLPSNTLCLTAYFFLDTPTVRPRLPVVLVC